MRDLAPLGTLLVSGKERNLNPKRTVTILTEEWDFVSKPKGPVENQKSENFVPKGASVNSQEGERELVP